jgi:hypothetical protein
MSYNTNDKRNHFANGNSRPHYRTKGTTHALNNVMNNAQGTQLRTHFYKYVAQKSN